MADIAKSNIANALNSLTGVLGTTDQIVDKDSGKSVKQLLSNIEDGVKYVRNGSYSENISIDTLDKTLHLASNNQIIIENNISDVPNEIWIGDEIQLTSGKIIRDNAKIEVGSSKVKLAYNYENNTLSELYVDDEGINGRTDNLFFDCSDGPYFKCVHENDTRTIHVGDFTGKYETNVNICNANFTATGDIVLSNIDNPSNRIDVMDDAVWLQNPVLEGSVTINGSNGDTNIGAYDGALNLYSTDNDVIIDGNIVSLIYWESRENNQFRNITVSDDGIMFKPHSKSKENNIVIKDDVILFDDAWYDGSIVVVGHKYPFSAFKHALDFGSLIEDKPNDTNEHNLYIDGFTLYNTDNYSNFISMYDDIIEIGGPVVANKINIAELYVATNLDIDGASSFNDDVFINGSITLHKNTTGGVPYGITFYNNTNTTAGTGYQISALEDALKAEVATTTKKGLMSSTDKVILDSLADSVIRVRKYGTNLATALTAAIAAVDSTKTTILDCSDFTGNITISQTIVIDKPCTIQFGNCTITSTAANFFEIKSNNVTILGLGRQTDRTTSVSNSTTFVLTGSTAINNDSDKGYHIYSKGNKNLRFEYFTLKGTRTTLGRQCGNASYPINGCGGIHIDKENPLAAGSGNTCNNIIINQLLIDGTKAHGIYINTPILSKITNTRLSYVAGHGIFLNGGTSITLDNVYVASAQLAAYCTLSVTYCTFLNTVAETCAIGYLLRSSNNVSLFSPGCEQTCNQGTTVWNNAKNVSGKYGFNITATDGTNTSAITDVNSDLYNQFSGTPYFIQGGNSISLYTPYATGICGAKNYNNATSTATAKTTSVLRIVGNAQDVFVNNIRAAGTTLPIYNDIRLEVLGGKYPNNVEISYNPSSSLISNTKVGTISRVDNTYAPVYIYSACNNIVVRNGNTCFTAANYEDVLNVDFDNLFNSNSGLALSDELANLEASLSYYTLDITQTYTEVTTAQLEELRKGIPIRFIYKYNDQTYQNIVTPFITPSGSTFNSDGGQIQISIPLGMNFQSNTYPGGKFWTLIYIFIPRTTSQGGATISNYTLSHALS